MGKPPPNDRLRTARLRTPSPSGSGRPMSRQELADAVNAWLYGHDPSEATLDANYVGKLERGAPLAQPTTSSGRPRRVRRPDVRARSTASQLYVGSDNGNLYALSR
jgi:hypothetical protein